MPETGLPLKPYHLFQHRGKHYCLNVEEMQAHALSEPEASLLERYRAAPDAQLSTEQIALLQKLALWGDDAKQTQPKPPEPDVAPLPVISLTLILTEECNLGCVYCYGQENNTGRMSEATARRAIDWFVGQAGNVQDLNVTFFGGEPLLMFPLMKKVADYALAKAKAASKEIAFQITTNGTLLDEEIIDFLKEYQVRVLVSLDGPKEIHDAQRPFPDGRGSYDLLLPKIQKLLAAIPQAVAHAVIMDDTDPVPIKASLKDLGFASISTNFASLASLDFADGQKAAPRDFSPAIAENIKESDAWLDLIKKRDSQKLHHLAKNSHLLTAMTALLHQRKRYHACGAGLGLLAVGTSGDLYLCHRFNNQEEYRLGSVDDNTYADSAYRLSPTLFNPLCRVCFARYYCAGSCKYDNAASCGSVHTPPKEICQLRQSELELAASVVVSLSKEDQEYLVAQGLIRPKPCLLDF